MTRTIVRNVRDISDKDREAIEHALGEELRDDQRLIVQVVSAPEALHEESPKVSVDSAYASLPDWCDVFAGLSSDEVEEVERTTRQRLNLGRESA